MRQWQVTGDDLELYVEAPDAATALAICQEDYPQLCSARKVVVIRNPYEPTWVRKVWNRIRRWR